MKTTERTEERMPCMSINTYVNSAQPVRATRCARLEECIKRRDTTETFRCPGYVRAEEGTYKERD